MTRHAAAAPDSALPVVAHSCTPYLFATGSWIYSQLVHLRRHEAIVLTDRTENRDVFPLREVYAYNEIHPLRQAFFRLKRGRVAGGRESRTRHVGGGSGGIHDPAGKGTDRCDSGQWRLHRVRLG